MYDWADQALDLLNRGAPAALVSVLAHEGSVPREAGTRMIVTPTGALGTIGGGRLEYQAMSQARALLNQPPGAWRIQDYPLGPLLGQCCGGWVRLLLEHLTAADMGWLKAVRDHASTGGALMLATHLKADRLVRLSEEGCAPPMARGARPEPGDAFYELFHSIAPPVLIFGAGHVGLALMQTLSRLPFRSELLDTRPDLLSFCAAGGGDQAQPGEGGSSWTPNFAAEDAAIARAATAPVEACLLIMTHDHGLDYRLTLAALQGPACFVGLIGSATKRARFLRRLRDDGLDEATLVRLICPIGLPGIPGKEPNVIAIAVAAQLLSLRPVGAR